MYFGDHGIEIVNHQKERLELDWFHDYFYFPQVFERSLTFSNYFKKF